MDTNTRSKRRRYVLFVHRNRKEKEQEKMLQFAVVAVILHWTYLIVVIVNALNVHGRIFVPFFFMLPNSGVVQFTFFHLLVAYIFAVDFNQAYYNK